MTDETTPLEAAARALYEREAARARHCEAILSRASGKPIKDTMEPWAEARELYIGDARAALEAARRLVQSLEEVPSSSNIQPLRDALKRLVIAARTSGGVAGRDEVLCDACNEAEKVLNGDRVNVLSRG